MTDNEKARAHFLLNEYDEAHKFENPIKKGKEIFDSWYGSHTKDKPMPKELKAIEKDISKYVRERDQYVADNLARLNLWSAFMEYSRERNLFIPYKPCESIGYGQCSLFCDVYGTEECVYEKDL